MQISSAMGVATSHQPGTNKIMKYAERGLGKTSERPERDLKISKRDIREG